jgi:DNA-binding CsgD family transcriptional regulator
MQKNVWQARRKGRNMQQISTPKPLLSRDLVGRECELEQLGEALHRAKAGHPQFVLLSGESGVGKTRLCRAFLHQSREQHPLFFWGRALPQDQVVPFGPFLDAFRRSFDGSASPLLLPDQSLMPSFVFLLHLLPELAGRFPDLVTSILDDLLAPARRQSVLFHDMLLGLQALTGLHQTSLILVLEDLQWADETSLEFLMYLARRVDVNSTSSERSTPLLILGTYRSEALAESPALQRMLWHLQAQRHITELHLAPLSVIDHRRIVSSILDQAVPEEFADFLYQWDEGNPFYAEEFLGTMSATGQLQANPHGQGWVLPQQDRPPLPSSISAVILERLMRLPPVDQEVLTMASVIGRTFDFRLLAAVCDLDEYALADVLSRAINRQFLSEVIGTTSLGLVEPLSVQYHFRHALIRETIYDRIHMAECRLRHRTVAETIERLHTRPSASGSAQLPSLDRFTSLLVTHYRLAGLLDQAHPYALQAAQQASKLCAFREERFYLEVAQESLPEESPERLQLFERMGITSIAMFDFPAALHWLSLAREGYLRSGHSSQALAVLTPMHLSAWSLADSAEQRILDELECEVEGAFAQADPTKRDVYVLIASSYLTIYQCLYARNRRIFQLVERNNTLFAALTDPRKVMSIQISNIAYCWARANQHATFVEESIAELRNILTFAHQQSLPNILVFGYVTLLLLLIGMGRIDEAEHISKEAIASEELPDLMHPSYPALWLSFFSGEGWAQGIELLGNNRERMKQQHMLGLLAIDEVVFAHILIARGELREAKAYLFHAQPILERMNEDLFLLWMGWGFAKLSIAQGKPMQAQDWYEGTLARWQTTDDTLSVLPILLDGITFYAQIGNLQQARHWLTHLQHVTATTENPVGKAALLEAQGIIAAQQKKLQSAVEALRQAVQAWGALKFRYRQAAAEHYLAELLLQQGERKTMDHKTRQQQREEAEGLLYHAAHVYEQLGIADQAEAVQRLRGYTRLDAQRKRRRTLATQRQAGGLTSRELQTLQLLAAGKTNNEIARALGISLSTVELHVTHILTKLNCENRTQAVLYAVSRGWIPLGFVKE